MADESVAQRLSRYPTPVKSLALETRRLIKRLLPRVNERVDPSSPIIGYSYGAGYRGMVCVLSLSKSGVKLGIGWGAELNDPHGLLEGAGKVHRHIPLKTSADLRQRGVDALIKAAAAACRARL